MNNEHNQSTDPQAPPSRWRFSASGRAIGTGAFLVALMAGAAAGVGGTRLVQRFHPQVVMLLQPAPIAQMKDAMPVAVKGKVAEIFGNKFVVQDDSGRALVDTGPRGDGRKIVDKGEAMTVQGRFDRGVIHAQVIAHADGRTEAFDPPRPPRPHHKPPPPPPGPRADRGPHHAPPPPPPGDRGPGADRAPPPPPSAADRAPPPAPGNGATPPSAQPL
jgi:hypothetical protein